jgi:hypothetical protein
MGLPPPFVKAPGESNRLALMLRVPPSKAINSGPETYLDLDVGENYIANSLPVYGTTGWTVAKNTSAATTPDSGFSTSSTNITWTRTTTNPIHHTADWLLTKGAANRQGEFAYSAFTMPLKDRGKMCQIRVPMVVESGTFADDAVRVFVWDVTNARVIEPSPNKFKNASITTPYFFEFQSSIDSTSYRLLVFVSGSDADAYTLRLGKIQVGPSELITNSVTGPISCAYYGTASTVTNAGDTTIVYSTKMHDTIGAYNTSNGRFVCSVPGTYRFSAAYETAAITASAVTNPYVIQLLKNGSSAHLQHYYAATTSSQARVATITGDIEMAIGDYVEVSASQQLVGGAQALSNTRRTSFSAELITSVARGSNQWVTAASYYASASSANISIAATGNEIIDFDTKSFDSVGSATVGASWQWVAKESGYYRVSSAVMLNSVADTKPVTLYLYKSGTLFRMLSRVHSSASESITPSGCALVQLNAGEYIHIQLSNGDASARNIETTAGFSWIDIEKLAGPAQIPASDSVNVRATGSTSSTATGAGAATVIFSTESYDSHGSYDNTTGIFTALTSGKFKIKGQIGTNAATAGSAERVLNMYVFKNGLSVATKYNNIFSNSTSSRQVFGEIEDTVQLLAGETLRIGWTHNWGVTLTCSGDARENVLTVERVGNY